MKRWIILLTLLTLSLTALASAQTGNPDQDTLVRDNIAFAFDLYQIARQDGGNLIFSPYSISQALAMTYGGAGGTTAEEMAGALHFSLPQETLHPTFLALNTDLNTRANSRDTEDPFQFHIANALWGQAGFGFNPTYLDLVNANYSGGMYEVNFKTDPAGSRQLINGWVAEQTEDKIQDLVPELSPDTRLILTNAIYFKASWLDQFEVEATQDGDFFLLDGNTVTAPLMSMTEGLQYIAGEGYQALSLPYAGDDKAMLIILPEAGTFEAFEAGFTPQTYTDIWLGLQYNQVWVTLPRFTLEYETSLVDALQQLGMVQAFTTDANFDAMIMPGTPDKLFISDVIHKAFIALDETGTEAAAATAVIMETAGAAPSEPVEFRADHPFIYMIYDQSNGTILFMGRVLNPGS